MKSVADGRDGRDGRQGLRGFTGAEGGHGRDGRDGINGKDGDSPYEAAVKHGFIGSEKAWLESLHGRDGFDGKSVDPDAVRDLLTKMVSEIPKAEDGRDGRDGVNGKDGKAVTGPRGPEGPKGPPGPKGDEPDHEWRGTELRFELPTGDWGQWVDLRGQAGRRTGGGGTSSSDSEALPQLAEFTPSAVPLRGRRYALEQTVSDVIAFVIDETGAIEGGSYDVDLIADGVNEPTFTGSREWDFSSGYVNVNGVRNCISFSRRSGISYRCINQQLGMAPEPGSPAVQIVRLGTLVNMTESGDGTAGWNYTSTTASGFGALGRADLSLPATTDGSIEHTIGDFAAGDCILTLATTAAAAVVDIFSVPYGIWINNVGVVTQCTNGVFTTVVGFTVADGDTIRLGRVGDTVIAYISTGGGAFVFMCSWAGASTAQLFGGVIGGGVGVESLNIRGTNLA